MSGGEPSSIKRKPSCAAELPILSPKCGYAAGSVLSNCPCAVLWGAELFRLKLQFQTKGYAEPAARTYPGGTKVPPFGRNFCSDLYKNPRACRGFLCPLRLLRNGLLHAAAERRTPAGGPMARISIRKSCHEVGRCKQRRILKRTKFAGDALRRAYARLFLWFRSLTRPFHFRRARRPGAPIIFIERRNSACIRLYTANGGRRRSRT